MIRQREARLLFGRGCFEGAYYLGGLGVECALKACIARTTRRFEFPPKRPRIDRIYSHDLNILLNEAGLKPPPALETHWAVVKDWRADVRYITNLRRVEVRDFLRAAYGRKGVMQWLRQCW